MFKDQALAGKVALVTGGSRGIGRAIAIALAHRGAKVVINYVGNTVAAEEARDLVQAAGGQAVLAKFDVSDADACQAAIKQIVADHGKLDILVNNAGIAINGLVMRYKDEQWKNVFDVNLNSMFYLVRAAASQILKAKDGGRIVNLSSVVGEMGNGGQAAYSAAKSAVIGLSKTLAREFASRGVTVNVVSPGFIETDMTQSELPEAARQKLLAEIPLGRIGAAAEVADMVSFLAGPEASYVTGQVLRCNGGLLM